MKVYAQAGTPDYYANLDLQYMRGEIPLSIYQRLNGKPYWYNLELVKAEIAKEYNKRRELEAKEKEYKEEYKKKVEVEVQKEFDKEIPKLLDKAMNELFKGLNK